MDRDLTQKQVVALLNVHPSFACDVENNRKTNSIRVLKKVTYFLGYIPKTLNIDESTLKGKLYAHRVKNGYSLYHVAQKINANKSTVSRFENGVLNSEEINLKISNYLTHYQKY